ncbi:MAG: hypothetical protein GWN86_00215, partial [Desulfobacterales bacterium]|nr:hypothetical protein [Desulfobacterales bacterium]
MKKKERDEIRLPIDLKKLEKFSEIELQDVEIVLDELEIRFSPARTVIPRTKTQIQTQQEVISKPKPISLIKEQIGRPSETYTGQVVEVKIGATKSEGGTRGKNITIGGEKTPAYYQFIEGTPNRP